MRRQVRSELCSPAAGFRADSVSRFDEAAIAREKRNKHVRDKVGNRLFLVIGQLLDRGIVGQRLLQVIVTTVSRFERTDCHSSAVPIDRRAKRMDVSDV